MTWSSFRRRQTASVSPPGGFKTASVSLECFGSTAGRPHERFDRTRRLGHGLPRLHEGSSLHGLPCAGFQEFIEKHAVPLPGLVARLANLEQEVTSVVADHPLRRFPPFEIGEVG